MPRPQFLPVVLLCAVAAGCSTTRTWDSLTARFSGSEDSDDALVLNDDSLTPGFRESQDRLKNAERTNLSFARWKEDVGQYAEAKQRYQEILTNNKDCLPARLGVARIERETGRFDQCREILMAAREQYPGNATVPLELGRMYSEREDWQQASRFLTEASEINPNDETIRYELGLALAQDGQYDQALSHLKYSVGNSAALYNIGFLLHESGRAEESVDWFEKALAAHPDERTRQLSTEMLADLRSSLSVPGPSAPYASETAVAAARRPSANRRMADVRPAPPRQDRWQRATTVSGTTPAPTRPASWTRQVAAPIASPPHNPVPVQQAVTSATTAQTAPWQTTPAWPATAAPAEAQPVQPPQWAATAQQGPPVHTTGYSQPVPASTTGHVTPPAWRR